MNRRQFSKAVACIPLIPAGYQYKSHRCPVGKDNVLQTRPVDVRDREALFRQLYRLVNCRNAAEFGGHPAGTLMLTGYRWEQGVWEVEIRKPKYDENSLLVTSGFLHHVYPIADFTPLEAFLP